MVKSQLVPYSPDPLTQWVDCKADLRLAKLAYKHVDVGNYHRSILMAMLYPNYPNKCQGN